MLANLDLPGSNLQYLTIAISSITSLLLCLGLFNSKKEIPGHKSLVLFLFAMAIANGFRIISWVEGHVIIITISYMAFIFVPIFLVIFLEEALRQMLHPLVKIILLITCISLLLTLLFSDYSSNRIWKFIYIIYLQYSAILIMSLSFRGIRKTECNNERSVYTSVFFTGILCVVFVGIDLLSVYIQGINLRLSAVGVLALNYFLASILLSSGSYKFRKHIRVLAMMIVSSFIISVFLVIGFFDKMNLDLISEIALVILSCEIPLYIVDKLFGITASTTGSDTLKRLNKLNMNSIKSLLQGISNWDEVKRFHLLSNEYLKEKDLEFIFREQELIDYENIVLTKKIISRKFKNETSNLIKGLNHVLLLTDCDYLIVLPSSREVLVASFSNMMNKQYFKDIVLFIKREIVSLNSRSQEVQYE